MAAPTFGAGTGAAATHAAMTGHGDPLDRLDGHDAVLGAHAAQLADHGDRLTRLESGADAQNATDDDTASDSDD